MRCLIDTNVIIDIFAKREPWFHDSISALHALFRDKNSVGLLSASSITDIFYLLRKSAGKETAKTAVEELCQIMEIADVQDMDIQRALRSSLSDFEDAVVDSVAFRHENDYIITRNVRDFAGSSVPAISPSDFLSNFS